MAYKDGGKRALVVPGIAWIAIFTVFPLLYALRLSLYATRLGAPERFVWLQNFVRAAQDYRLWNAMGVSFLLAGASVALTVSLGLGVALLFNRPIRGQRILRSLFVLPVFSAPVALGWLGLTIFHENLGPLNVALRGLGVSSPPGWLHSVWAARAAVVLVDSWQWTPFCFLVLLAALEGVPKEIYESARLETSSGWVIFGGITLPMIAPALLTVTVLRLVETIKMFDIPFTMTSGGPGAATQTVSLYIYQVGFRGFNPGYASALATVLLLVMFPIGTFFFARLRAGDS